MIAAICSFSLAFAEGRDLEDATGNVFTGTWIGEQVMTFPNSPRSDGSATSITIPVTLVISRDAKRVLVRLQGTPGRVHNTTAQDGRILRWGGTDKVSYPGYGKALTRMSMSLTVDIDRSSATLQGSHTVLEGPLKGLGDSAVTAVLRKINEDGILAYQKGFSERRPAPVAPVSAPAAPP